MPVASQAKVTGLLMVSTTCSSAGPSILGGTDHTHGPDFIRIKNCFRLVFAFVNSHFSSNTYTPAHLCEYPIGLPLDKRMQYIIIQTSTLGTKSFLTIDVKMEVLVHLACYIASLADIQASIRHLKHRVDIQQWKTLPMRSCFGIPLH